MIRLVRMLRSLLLCFVAVGFGWLSSGAVAQPPQPGPGDPHEAISKWVAASAEGLDVVQAQALVRRLGLSIEEPLEKIVLAGGLNEAQALAILDALAQRTIRGGEVERDGLAVYESIARAVCSVQPALGPALQVRLSALGEAEARHATALSRLNFEADPKVAASRLRWAVVTVHSPASREALCNRLLLSFDEQWAEEHRDAVFAALRDLTFLSYPSEKEWRRWYAAWAARHGKQAFSLHLLALGAAEHRRESRSQAQRELVEREVAAWRKAVVSSIAREAKRGDLEGLAAWLFEEPLQDESVRRSLLEALSSLASGNADARPRVVGMLTQAIKAGGLAGDLRVEALEALRRMLVASNQEHPELEKLALPRLKALDGEPAGADLARAKAWVGVAVALGTGHPQVQRELGALYGRWAPRADGAAQELRLLTLQGLRSRPSEEELAAFISEVLIAALDDASPQVRRLAGNALAGRAEPDHAQPIAKRLAIEPDPKLRRAFVQNLHDLAAFSRVEMVEALLNEVTTRPPDSASWLPAVLALTEGTVHLGLAAADRVSERLVAIAARPEGRALRVASILDTYERLKDRALLSSFSHPVLLALWRNADTAEVAERAWALLSQVQGTTAGFDLRLARAAWFRDQPLEAQRLAERAERAFLKAERKSEAQAAQLVAQMARLSASEPAAGEVPEAVRAFLKKLGRPGEARPASWWLRAELARRAGQSVEALRATQSGLELCKSTEAQDAEGRQELCLALVRIAFEAAAETGDPAKLEEVVSAAVEAGFDRLDARIALAVGRSDAAAKRWVRAHESFVRASKLPGASVGFGAIGEAMLANALASRDSRLLQSVRALAEDWAAPLVQQLPSAAATRRRSLLRAWTLFSAAEAQSSEALEQELSLLQEQPLDGEARRVATLWLLEGLSEISQISGSPRAAQRMRLLAALWPVAAPAKLSPPTAEAWAQWGSSDFAPKNR